ncbi:isopentenyl-diphosphate Delta-isomerase [uncultured Amnibacterium sp.]|uniref:isopentenyl-diphosphate Delta-isomerase n=1 Tax=uncultured Amnibacterium sp. TaxID=1631851 RepID=UPI0035CA9BA0
MTDRDERVVLVDDDGEPVGTALKADVHTTETPLHLAFSCHLRDGDGRLLVTRRALSKTTWPGVWTNSFCGHPSPGEDLPSALARRAFDELGVTLTDVRLVLPDFRYRAVDAGGIVENEICPVFAAVTFDDVQPDPDEVAEYRWVDPQDLETAVSMAPWAFSPWLNLQLVELSAVRA